MYIMGMAPCDSLRDCALCSSVVLARAAAPCRSVPVAMVDGTISDCRMLRIAGSGLRPAIRHSVSLTVISSKRVSVGSRGVLSKPPEASGVAFYRGVDK